MLDDSMTKYVKKYSINQVLGGIDHNTKRVTTGLGFAARIVSFIDIILKQTMSREFLCKAFGSVTGILQWIDTFLGKQLFQFKFSLQSKLE